MGAVLYVGCIVDVDIDIHIAILVLISQDGQPLDVHTSRRLFGARVAVPRGPLAHLAHFCNLVLD